MLKQNEALSVARLLRPAQPVTLVRPHAARRAARFFLSKFPGTSMYAVKANPSADLIRTLWDAGLTHYDVASIAEVRLVRETLGTAPKLCFMHPVKAEEAIAEAYHVHGVRTFSLDCIDELNKILDATGGADDLNLIVRMAVSADGAAYTLSGKFGVSSDQAPALLMATRQAVKDGLMGVSFHVGSQCMRPTAYQAAMAQVGRSISRAGVIVDIVDVGGGFPSVYPGMVPPDMSEYADAIHRGFNEMPVSETTELWCEPGRAIVAESSSILARVDLRKGDALYLNDGSYGSLFDATHSRWPFPTKLVRDGEASGELKAFQFYGPTCDSIDHMPGPFWLPADVREGDFIEIGMLGAYGVAMTTGFNGYGEHDIAAVEDAPMASLYGLAPRSIPTVRTTAEENARKVVRLSRPKGKAGQRKSRRK